MNADNITLRAVSEGFSTFALVSQVESSSIEVSATSSDETGSSTYTAQIVDPSGNDVKQAGVSVSISVNGNSYSATTDSNGIATTTVPENPGTYTVDATSNGLNSGSTSMTYSASTAGTPTQTPTSPPSGGGGGGGTSGEAFENILIQENDRQSVFMDDNVAFSFDMDGNIVRYVNFTSLTSSGTIVSKVEMLNHTSTMVDVAAPDSVFKNLNIWLGNLGWASDQNIREVTITFEVNRSWIQENNIDPDTVTLSRYTNDTGTPIWLPLQTTLVAEEDEFLVYMSITTPDGFGNFAVVGVEIGGQPQATSTPVVTSTGTSSGTPVTEPTPASTGGSNFTWLIIGFVILLLVVGVGYIERDLITKWLNERRP